MEGLFVFVCEYGTNRCFPCGVMLSADAATWASVYCTGGMILGNEVQLRHPYERLLFCEIEIFGQTEGIILDKIETLNTPGLTLLLTSL